MKKLISILLMVIFLVAPATGCSGYDPDKRYSLAELREDLDNLQTLADQYHPYYFADKNEVAGLFRKQSGLLRDGMTELEFYRILSPIISSWNCGHSYMKFSKNLEAYSAKHGNYLPLRVKIMADKAYVLKSSISEEIPAGSEIVEINGKPAKEIIGVFLDNIASDGENMTFKYFKINRDFNKLFFAYFDSTKTFDIKYINANDGKVMEKKLAAVSMTELYGKAESKKAAAERKKPRLEINTQENYALLTVSSFDFYSGYDRMLFNDIIDSYFKQIKADGVSNLIMDFRGNIGGAPDGAAHLLTYLAKEPVPYFADTEATAYYKALIAPMPLAGNRFTGNVYTLIDGGCFSTTSHLCALLKYHKIGVFIGEETGGSFVCSDSSADAELKNTKLIAHGSTQVYATAVQGLPKGRGIMPDYPVMPTINDYLDNKDAVKQFAIDFASNTAYPHK